MEAGGAELAQAAATELGCVLSVTGPVDHVSDGVRTFAVSNGDPLLATVSGTGCMSTAVTGSFLAVRADTPLEGAAEALVAFGVAGEDAAGEAKGPGTFHAALYDALYGLGLVLGRSAATVEEAKQAEEDGAHYIGAGPVWTTPSKADADPPIGLDGLSAIAAAVSVPVVAIGGIDETNAADCIAAGATGV